MARRKRGRDIDGVVLLDKPAGCTSNKALQRVRRSFDARKAGHTGSLDPLATGLLPICLGEATKVAGYMLSARKSYRVTAAVGAETTTGDLEGEIREYRDAPMPGADELAALLGSFVGAQQQIPPMYSALKRDGKRLYEHARAGVCVEREPRAVVVYDIALSACDDERLTLEVEVSSGTYVRTLIEDIARAWGGRAHVVDLRRIGVGALGRAQPMTALAEIEACRGDEARLARLLWPLSIIMSDWYQVTLGEDAARAIAQGQPVACDDASAHDDEPLRRIVDTQARTLGLGTLDSHKRLAPKRLFVRPLA